VNWQHFQAFLWLRWRLLVNQMRRGGTANTVLAVLLVVGIVLLAAVLALIFFFVGLFLKDYSAGIVMYVWDGLVVAFLFSWTLGLMIELQRAEVLSLDKFLHLPVSLAGAFLVNYFSSLLSVTLLLFLPAMVGLSLGLVFSRGPVMLLLLPLLASFFLLVTALTHQFQGWLASLMANPRRRRTIIVVVTMAFVVICQLPNLLPVLLPRTRQQEDEVTARLANEEAELQRAYASGKITAPQYRQRKEAIEHGHQSRLEDLKRQRAEHVEETARLINLVVPPGWLPLGAMALGEGDVLPALLGTLGLTLLGTASLWRSYRTTVRLYRGQFTAGRKGPAAAPPPAPTGRPAVRLLERELPGLSEHASAIALGGFRALLRAPEAKLMLLTPVILVMVFGSMVVTQAVDPPEAVRPLMATGAMAVILLSMVQLVGNQFGFDRNGFRVFVLCPARRRDVLLGKNLAVAPLALGMGAVTAVVLQAIYRMRWDYFLAVWPQFVSMFLLFCLLANALSILAPIHIAAGSFKPTNLKAIPALLQVAFLLVFPLAMLPTLLPLGVQLALEALGWVRGVPLCLALSLLECVAVVYLYRLVLTWEGSWLQAREQRILDIVTSKAE
jgi:ABC-2 type transport system permease protein